ncbi:hypothetical protein [Kitasatospora sp. NPDC004289]
MAEFTVTHPDPGFKGDIVGITFTAGSASVDTGAEGGLAAYSYFQRAGYGLTEVAAPEPEPAEFTEFDPTAHGVKDVLAYLASLDDEDERARVLAAEAAGQARKGVLGDQQTTSTETGGPAANDQKEEGQ